MANLLKLPFPGGPSIDRLSQGGNPKAIPFPRAWMRGTYDFSFSGLKTAVANYLRANTNGHRPRLSDVCASFQEAVVDVLVRKTLEAAQACRLRSVVVGGGVAANRRLRAAFQAEARDQKLQVFLPDVAFCTDNAAMIAAGGYFKLKILGRRHRHLKTLNVDANLPVKSWRAA